jgi:hypothetical protein
MLNRGNSLGVAVKRRSLKIVEIDKLDFQKSILAGNYMGRRYIMS